MASRQEQRSEETKKSILTAAGELFGSRGFDAVTMRDIAKQAGCSHTTIYIYFKDKEALLHQLSMPPIQYLLGRMDVTLSSGDAPESKLKALSLTMIAFCLSNRNLYGVIFNTKSGRVDEAAPRLEINQARNALFGKLQSVMQSCLGEGLLPEFVLMYARIYYFALFGVIATYAASEESADQLMDRLRPTFEETFEVMLTGIRQRSRDRIGQTEAPR